MTFQIDIRVRVVPPTPGFQYRDEPEAPYNSTDPTFLADGSTAGFVEVRLGYRYTIIFERKMEEGRGAKNNILYTLFFL